MSVTARVRVILDIKADGTWGDDCTVGQVKKQALENVERKLRKALDRPGNIKVISGVECFQIIHKPEED